MHELMKWLLGHGYGNQKDTPLGVFTRRYAAVLPVEGALPELRAAIVTYGQSQGEDPFETSWQISCLEVAWDLFQPKCSWVDCSALALPNGVLCKAHELLELL